MTTPSRVELCAECKTRGIPGTPKFNWPLCDDCLGKVSRVEPLTVEPSKCLCCFAIKDFDGINHDRRCPQSPQNNALTPGDLEQLDLRCCSEFNLPREYAPIFAKTICEAISQQPPSRPVPEQWPQKCHLCDGMMHSADDRCEWHGLGNCVEICERCNGSGEEPKEVARPVQVGEGMVERAKKWREANGSLYIVNSNQRTWHDSDVANYVSQEVAAERERCLDLCAIQCEATSEVLSDAEDYNGAAVATNLAITIRALPNPAPAKEEG